MQHICIRIVCVWRAEAMNVSYFFGGLFHPGYQQDVIKQKQVHVNHLCGFYTKSEKYIWDRFLTFAIYEVTKSPNLIGYEYLRIKNTLVVKYTKIKLMLHKHIYQVI